MIEWNLFYKMLGIPEDVTEPTYYDLLGVHPKTCNAEIVDSMLNRRRSRLRQNIPGPQFIPLVLKFEQKKLEHAAAVLRDPEIRQKYNRYLQKKARERKSEKQKERTRQNLLQNARNIVNSLLNPDKTLDDSKRPILTAKLRNLGIREGNINSLLERIPRPAAEVARPNNESMEYFVTAVDLAIGGNMLTLDAERKILELAKKLGIDHEQARKKIDQKLKERNARRGESDFSQLKSEFENRVLSMVPDGLATQDQYGLLLALAKADNVPEELAREVLRRCLTIVGSPGAVLENKNSNYTVSVDNKDQAGNVVPEYETSDTEEAPVASQHSRHRRHILPIAVIVSAVGILILSVSLFVISGRRNPPEPKSSSPETSSNNTPTTPQHEQKPLVSNRPLRIEGSDSAEFQQGSRPRSLNQVPVDFGPRAESEVPPSPEPILPIQRQLTIRAED
ncbi:MAG: hypothetical protein JSW47_04535, partial [Phycisphaerales bacterium]